MIYAVIVIGILLISVGVKGTEHELAAQLGSDMTGNTGFVMWFAALSIIGCLGFIPGFEKPSRYMIGLVLVVIVLSNQSFVTNLITGIAQAAQAGPAAGVALQAGSSSSSSGGSGGGSSSTVGEAAQVVGAIYGI